MRLGIANGRVRVRYGCACYGYTRGNGTVWHGGIDLELLDGTTFYMPTYKGKKIRGKVITARIVTDHSNRTWEWGYYICVRLDANQTPDAVNYLYFCHCSKLLAKVGDVVESGDALGVMGNTGNAALADPPYAHVHFEVRATSTGKGLDPTAYSGTDNKVGTYGEAPTPVAESTKLIDVSKYQGQINWALVPYKALIRIGYRGYLDAGTLAADPYFEANVTGALDNDKLAGFYFFTQAKNATEAKEEAEFACNLLAGRGKGLPLFYDSEWGTKEHTGRADGVSKNVKTECAKAFCEKVRACGYLPGIYTFTDFAHNYIDYTGLVNSGYIGWLSDTRAAFNTTLPRHIHQYGQAPVTGIFTGGDVDMNNLIKDWNSSATDQTPTKLMQKIEIGPVSNGDAMAIYNLANSLRLVEQGLYSASYV